MEEMGLMERILIYGFSFLLLLSVMAYQLSKMRSHLALINKKYRFGAIGSALMVSLPMFILFAFIGFGPEIKALLGAATTSITVVSLILMFVLMIVALSIMQVPIDREKYRTDLRAKREKYPGWHYYIIDNPYVTLQKSVRLPSWGSRTPSHQEYIAWAEKTKDNPPAKIQLLILLVSYIITSVGLAIIGYVSHQWVIMILNLTLIPFFIFTIILAPLLFWLIDWSEIVVSKIVKRKLEFTQARKFIFYHLGYILLVIIVVGLFWAFG